MDRREFLKSTAVGAATAAASVAAVTVSGGLAEAAPVAPSLAKGGRRLTMSMPWADDGRGYGDSARRLARRIETLTGGEIRVEPAPNAEASDLIHGTAHDFASSHPAFAYFAGLPGKAALAPADLDAWLTIGGGQELWDALARAHGLKPLLVGHSGTAPPLWSRAPLRGLEDLVTARVFAMGLGADVARALGAEPVQVAPLALTGGLSDDRVSFAEWGGALQSLALGLQGSAAYAAGDGLNGQGTALCLSVRLPVWDSLGDAGRSLLGAAATEEFRLSVAESRAHEMIVRKAITDGWGVRFAPFPPDVADAIVRVADAVVAHTSGYDRDAARIDRSYMSFKSAVGAFIPIS